MMNPMPMASPSDRTAAAGRGERGFLRPWSADDRQALATLHAEELSCPEIARRLERTVEAVANMSRRLGLRRRDTAQPWTPEHLALLERMLADGRSLREIAEATGHPRSSVADKLRRLSITSQRFRKPWSQRERETVLALHGEGAGLALIAAALPSRSLDAIQQKLQELVGPAPFRTTQSRRHGRAAIAAAPPPPTTPGPQTSRPAQVHQATPARPAPRLVRERPPPPPAFILASTDEMIRWLRSRDFMVLHRPSGWQVDRHVLEDEPALLEFVNTRRARLALPPFASSRFLAAPPPVMAMAAAPPA